MKVTIGEYTVDIKASHYGDKYSKEDALYFLNYLSMVFNDASKYNKLAYDVTAKDYHYNNCKRYNEIANDLYNTVKINGGYNR